MSRIDDFYVPHLEWEAVAFPLTLHGPTFEGDAYVLEGPATITLWRDANLQLKASLQTRLKDPRALDRGQHLGKGNIVRQLEVKARDADARLVVLTGCVLGGSRFNSYEANEDCYLVTLELLFDTARIVFTEAPADRQLEWFLVEGLHQYWRGSTKRCLTAALPKVRVGLDPEIADDFRAGQSVSKDHFLLEVPEFRCIVAEVPREFTGELRGICLEFRDGEIEKLDAGLLDDLKGFLSLLLGAKLYYMGYSRITGGALSEAFLDSPDVPLKVPVAMQPIRYNLHHDWGNFALQASLLFPRYRALQAKLFLNHVMERYWIAQAVPVGANLPVLAGGLEIIASAYLKMTGNNANEYLPQPAYDALIREEFLTLTEKLSGLPGGEVMLNKIKGAFRKGPNEKFNLFFELIGLEIGTAEKEAIKLRNKMTHSRIDYSEQDKAHDDIVSTRVYQALFNRTLLRILGYDGYYIDYSTKGLPLKPIT